MMKGMIPHVAALTVLLLPSVAFGQENLVTLTNIPGLTQDMGGASKLPEFLNGLYNFCIGIAVVLAVIQLIRAGIEYMTAGGSIGSTEHAKHLITTSILGLVLVLSPYIVFSIVNPRILDLEISADKLETTLPTGTPGAAGNNGAETTTETKDGCKISTNDTTQAKTVTCTGKTPQEATSKAANTVRGACGAGAHVQVGEEGDAKGTNPSKDAVGANGQTVKGTNTQFEATGYCSPKKGVSLVYFGVSTRPSVTEGIAIGGDDQYYAAIIYGAEENEKWASACGKKLRTDRGMIFDVNQPKNMIQGGFQCPMQDEKFKQMVQGQIQGKGTVGVWCANVQTYCAQ